MIHGRLTDDELELLNKMWKEMVDRGLEIRDSVAASTGYTGDNGGTTQSGKPGGFAAMSQEQGTKLEGLFVSGQMHWASIDERMQDVSEPRWAQPWTTCGVSRRTPAPAPSIWARLRTK